MGASIWRDFFRAAVQVCRRRTPGQDEALRAERARGVDRLGRDVVRRNPAKPVRRTDSNAA